MARRANALSIVEESASHEEPWELHSREEECWDEPELPRQRARAELALLQGSWLSGPGSHQAEFLVAGDRFSIHFRSGVIYMGVFELDVDARPKTMDMRIEEGPAPHKGRTTWCIYELTEDTLHWCAARPGNKEGCRQFPSEYDPNYLSLTFRREKPRS